MTGRGEQIMVQDLTRMMVILRQRMGLKQVGTVLALHLSTIAGDSANASCRLAVKTDEVGQQ